MMAQLLLDESLGGAAAAGPVDPPPRLECNGCEHATADHDEDGCRAPDCLCGATPKEK